MADVRDFITVYDNVLSEKMCQQLIDKFESHSALQSEERNQLNSLDWRMQFNQINLSEHIEFSEENDVLKQLFFKAISVYKNEHNILPQQWPETFKLEPIRMKRYLPNSNDGFDSHVDVTDYASARRFLVFFIYLNDGFKGGETDFVQLQAQVKPKQGRLIMFPPMWNWLHQANSVKGQQPKYIVGSYMHYV